MDVDGVLTDGSLILLPNWEYARTMNIKDGYALQLAVKKGYHVVVISGAQYDEGVVTRMKNLGVTDVHMGIKDKSTVLINHIIAKNYQPEEVLFIGDDIPDLMAFQHAGLRCAPADAAHEVIEAAHYVSPHSGGKGCVRDVIEKVLKLNDDWQADETITSK